VLDRVTRTTQFKMRVENLAASLLGESSDKALSAKHAYQAMLKQPLINLREVEPGG